MQSKAKTVNEYLDSLPPQRREAISTLRQLILKSLPKGYEEGMQYGMIGYFVPLSIFPDGYLNYKNPAQPLPYAALASQKNHMAIYLNNLYASQSLTSWFEKEFKKTGKKLDMGRSCIRFTKLENLPLDLIAKAVSKTSVKDFITLYKASRKRA